MPFQVSEHWSWRRQRARPPPQNSSPISTTQSPSVALLALQPLISSQEDAVLQTCSGSNPASWAPSASVTSALGTRRLQARAAVHPEEPRIGRHHVQSAEGLHAMYDPTGPDHGGAGRRGGWIARHGGENIRRWRLRGNRHRFGGMTVVFVYCFCIFIFFVIELNFAASSSCIGQSERAFPRRGAVFQPIILKDLVPNMKMCRAVCVPIKLN